MRATGDFIHLSFGGSPRCVALLHHVEHLPCSTDFPLADSTNHHVAAAVLANRELRALVQKVNAPPTVNLKERHLDSQVFVGVLLLDLEAVFKGLGLDGLELGLALVLELCNPFEFDTGNERILDRTTYATEQ